MENNDALIYLIFAGEQNFYLEKPTTKNRRSIPTRNTVKFISDYIDDYSSGEIEPEESSTDDEEETEKAKETAQILAVSTVGLAKHGKNKGQNSAMVTRDSLPEEGNSLPEEPYEGAERDSEIVERSDQSDESSEDSDGFQGPFDQSETDNEEFIDTRSNVPKPNLSLYNGTNDFDLGSQDFKDSLGLSEIGDVEAAHVSGPSAYNMIQKGLSRDQIASTKSDIEDPEEERAMNETPTVEVNSLWNDAQIAEEKLANIPYPSKTGLPGTNVFVSEDGLRRGDIGKQKTEVKKVDDQEKDYDHDEEVKEHKKLITDMMRNVNGGKTIGEKLSGHATNKPSKTEPSADGIQVIRSMNTRRLSNTNLSRMNKNSGKLVEKKTNKKESSKEDTQQQASILDHATFKNLKMTLKKQKSPVKNKTWEAEVNSLFPVDENKRITRLKEGEVSTKESGGQMEQASKKHNVHVLKTINKPTSKETTTNKLEASTKRQCVGISVADCIGPDSVTFNLPMNGQGEYGVQVNQPMPGLPFPQGGYAVPQQSQSIYPPNPNQYPPSPDVLRQQQFGSFQGLNGFNNQDRPHDYPGAFPDHYPNNTPNMPESSPDHNKKRPAVPTMKPSENSIFKAGASKKKKKKPKTTPKPKKTTKCPDCNKPKKVKASGGKKIPITDKLWKVKKRPTTTATPKIKKTTKVSTTGIR